MLVNFVLASVLANLFMLAALQGLLIGRLMSKPNLCPTCGGYCGQCGVKG